MECQLIITLELTVNICATLHQHLQPQVQLGVRGKIMFTLVNDEHLPFSFSLDKGTYDASDALLAASGGKPLLDIQPASGTVAANSKVSKWSDLTALLLCFRLFAGVLPLTLPTSPGTDPCSTGNKATCMHLGLSVADPLAAGLIPLALVSCIQVELCAVYAPQAERPINYNVVVRVRNKPTPLVLNVKGEGYALQPSMLLELPDDGSLEMSPAGINTLDFGQVTW